MSIFAAAALAGIAIGAMSNGESHLLCRTFLK